ncbi:FAD dependent oxidoreductase [Abortiporus biennis]|nr:FAD dependent oxidoreductase [Abortiporus biennis]
MQTTTALPVPLNVYSEHQEVIGQKPSEPYQAPLPQPNSTKAFWFTGTDVNPSPTEGSDGPLPEDADICIIGSGITGVSAAYHLANAFKNETGLSRPVRAVILEAREFCSGATGRNGGHLTAHPFPNFVNLEKKYGTDEALRALAIEKYTVDAISKIIKSNGKESEVDLVPGGRLNLFFTQNEHDEAIMDFEAAKAAGADISDIEWFSKEEVEKRFGAIYSGVLTPGNNLWPLKLVADLYNLANQISPSTFSVNVHTLTPVTSIETIAPTKDASQATFTTSTDKLRPRFKVVTPRGKIGCSYVLHATNAYVSHLLPQVEVVPSRGQIIAIRSNVTEEELTKTAGTGNDGFEYWFPRPLEGGQQHPLVIIGGGREVTKPKFEFYETDDGSVNPAVGKALREFLPAVYPGKYDAGKEPEMEWTGIMGYTKSGDPFVGPVVDERGEHGSYDGQYISAGYTGHGMPRAFACAQAVAGMIVSDIVGKSWTLPKWLPRNYLTVKNLGE